MPDEIEVPLETVQDKLEELHHHHHAPSHAEPNAESSAGDGKWLGYVAVCTALLAVVAAIGALQSGLLINEALLQKNAQIGYLTQASDSWSYYQAEGLKSLIYQTAAQSQPPASPAVRGDLAQSRHYSQKQTQIKQQAEALVAQSEQANKRAEHYLSRHHIFAFSVSLCQIAIALSAVAALTRRRRVWFAGLAAGVASALLLIYGFL